MALLTLETEHQPCPWPAIEALLEELLPGLEPLAHTESRRTYQCPLAAPGGTIPLFKELQARLAPADIHFFVELKP
jgi:hypothetical protein